MWYFGTVVDSLPSFSGIGNNHFYKIDSTVRYDGIIVPSNWYTPSNFQASSTGYAYSRSPEMRPAAGKLGSAFRNPPASYPTLSNGDFARNIELKLALPKFMTIRQAGVSTVVAAQDPFLENSNCVSTILSRREYRPSTFRCSKERIIRPLSLRK